MLINRRFPFARMFTFGNFTNSFSLETSFDQVVNRRAFRRDDQRDDLPLHNAALQELLADVMKHESAWPFLRPVQQKEVSNAIFASTT